MAGCPFGTFENAQVNKKDDPGVEEKMTEPGLKYSRFSVCIGMIETVVFASLRSIIPRIWTDNE